MTDQPLNKSKFNWRYLLTGEGLKDWYKAWGGGIKLVVTIIVIALLFMGITGLYNYFFHKPKPQEQTVIVKKGGQATITNIQYQEPARKWWIPHLYTGIAGCIRSKGNSDFKNYEPELRIDIIGVRWDWY